MSLVIVVPIMLWYEQGNEIDDNDFDNHIQQEEDPVDPTIHDQV